MIQQASVQPKQIRSVDIEIGNVFDLSDPAENNSLYRIVNSLHMTTRPRTVSKQLLMQPGDTYSPRLREESERILRSAAYLYDAEVCVHNASAGSVDLRVKTRDVWSFEPGISFGRKGGVNSTTVEVSERNLFGRGMQLNLSRVSEVDRDATEIGFQADHLTDHKLLLNTKYADRTDGHAAQLFFGKPFNELDSRLSLMTSMTSTSSTEQLSNRGQTVNEFSKDLTEFDVKLGLSKGIDAGRVHRFFYSLKYRDESFSPSELTLDPLLVPSDRTYVYPAFGYVYTEDNYLKTHNQDQIGRTEDVYTGQTFEFEVGYAPTGLGSTTNSLLFSGQYDVGMQRSSKSMLLGTAEADGRVVQGKLENSTLDVGARYFSGLGNKFVSYAAITATLGYNLDIDQQVLLGGDNGLRGYPLRYSTGSNRFLATVEQRYYSDWYPFRLFRVGFAAFVDVGRVWGKSNVSDTEQAWLADVGIGLRLASTRSAFGKLIHVDLAFPLGARQDISNVQFLVSTKKRF
ncbi:MAG: hypothetical protein RJQ07_01525 [Pseudomonadales bacterium]